MVTMRTRIVEYKLKLFTDSESDSEDTRASGDY